MSSKTVAVTGATGAQGGAVVRALLQEPSKWKIVGLSRNPESDKAVELKRLGVDIRACDLGNLSEVEDALKGVYAVFLVTDWTNNGTEKEILSGKNLIDASLKLGVQHFVFSSLDSTNKISEGKMQVPEFDSKAAIEEYLIRSGLPHTLVLASGYYENLNRLINPNSEEKELQFSLPIPGDTKYPRFSVAETGRVVREVLSDRKRFLGKRIAMVGDFISFNELAAILSTKFGKLVKFNYVPPEVFAGFPFPGAPELAQMFIFINEYGYFGEKKNERIKDVAKLSTFAEWAHNWKV